MAGKSQPFFPDELPEAFSGHIGIVVFSAVGQRFPFRGGLSVHGALFSSISLVSVHSYQAFLHLLLFESKLPEISLQIKDDKFGV